MSILTWILNIWYVIYGYVVCKKRNIYDYRDSRRSLLSELAAALTLDYCRGYAAIGRFENAYFIQIFLSFGSRHLDAFSER